MIEISDEVIPWKSINSAYGSEEYPDSLFPIPN